MGLEWVSGGLYRGNAVGETELPGLDFTPHALAGNAIWGLVWNEAPAVIPRHVTHPRRAPRSPATAASTLAELAGAFGLR